MGKRRTTTKFIVGLGFIGLVAAWEFYFLPEIKGEWGKFSWWEEVLVQFVLIGAFLYGGCVTLWEGITGKYISDVAWWRKYVMRVPSHEGTHIYRFDSDKEP